jgi:hypothetical protein
MRAMLAMRAMLSGARANSAFRVFRVLGVCLVNSIRQSAGDADDAGYISSQVLRVIIIVKYVLRGSGGNIARIALIARKLAPPPDGQVNSGRQRAAPIETL